MLETVVDMDVGGSDTLITDGFCDGGTYVGLR